MPTDPGAPYQRRYSNMLLEIFASRTISATVNWPGIFNIGNIQATATASFAIHPQSGTSCKCKPS